MLLSITFLVKITEQVEAMYGGAVCRATRQAVSKSCQPNCTNRNRVTVVYTSVEALFFVLNTIQLYELRTIKPKGGFYTHVVFSSTYRRLVSSMG